MIRIVRFKAMLAAILLIFSARASAQTETALARVATHSFQPLNEDGSFTSDRVLKSHGVRSLENDDWKIRLLALRDILKLLPQDYERVVAGLSHDSQHVRQIAAAAFGIARQSNSAKNLHTVLQSDPSALVRSQAAMSLGQMESTESLELLQKALKDDKSRDVQHQCELAIDQIEKHAGATAEQLNAFLNLDESLFEQIHLGQTAPDFALKDTDDQTWQLAKFSKGKWVVLVWIFADWCPVCHGEFSDLIQMQREFEEANATVATIECHDRFRCRLMVGKETDAKYWFSKGSFRDKYRSKIWWPHLSDLAGAIGAQYGVDPMCFAVHAEYVNRPSTIIIDPQGNVRFAYYGTFWGDRPLMHETLEMIKSESFDFVHPKRLK